MKKLLVRGGLLVGTLGVVIAGAAAFSAFEAHVVNVTATIENALLVDTTPIEFGNVFPQEYLVHDIRISLSDSFLATDRVDDVEYVIKQKPKVKQPCQLVAQGEGVLNSILGIKTANAQVLIDLPCSDPNVNPTPGNPYATIHVVGFGDNQEVFDGPAWQFCEEYLPEGAPYTNVNLNDPYWRYCYLPLADDLSKHSSRETDHSVDAFHHAYQWDNGEASLVEANIASGRLSKEDLATSTLWTIDLKVPCFVNACAQEASNPNNLVNDDIPGFHVPNEFRLPAALEHKTFGTDLWIEVTGISLAIPTPPATTAIHFIKVFCPSYSVLAGNAFGEVVDATGGHFTEFTNYSASEPHFPDPYIGKPVNPSEIPLSCIRVPGWQFKLSTDQDQTQDVTLTPLTGLSGQTDVNFTSLTVNQQNALLTNNNLWISEVQQPNVASFGAIRCFKDAVNGDNLELINAGGNPLPSDLYCIAYNVPNPTVVQ